MDHVGPLEVALSTDLRGEPYNFALWDIQTGTQLVVFKGNKKNPNAKCLQLIDNNYFITASDNVIHIWSIFNRKCLDQKLFLPARPSVLCVSPCGNYLAAGITEMLYIWQLRSGNLLAHSQRHYQAISALKMNFDGTFLVSGGEDGIVLVWPFADLISNTHNTGALNLPKGRNDAGVNEPRFSWQHHSGQVTDIHITHGGRCLTSSVDKTVNIYSYRSGKRLYCISMSTPIWSVVMNKNETVAFLGGQDGNIYSVAVSSLSVSVSNSSIDGQEQSESSSRSILNGHGGKVISLLVSLDGSRLVSASVDASCKIWDTSQRKLVQDIKHQAPLANLTSLIVPDSLALTSMSQSNTVPPLSLRPLKRNLHKQPRDSGIASEDLFEESNTAILHLRNNTDCTTLVPTSNGATQFNFIDLKTLHRQQENGLSQDNGKTEVEKSLKLKEKVRDLYMLAAEKIFKDAHAELLEPFKPLVSDIINNQGARAAKRTRSGSVKKTRRYQNSE